MNQTAQEEARPAGPCTIVIFGASGDLTRRKLIPALCNLALANFLPSQFAIVGFAFDALTTDSFRQQLSENIKTFATSAVDAKVWTWFLERIYYVQGDFNDAAAYDRLRTQLEQVEKEHGTGGNRLFYMAVAPQFIAGIIEELGKTSLAHEENGCWRRVIIEKPFGHDLDSARKLNADIRRILDESQIYRIDHYLGKETVQNIMVFRFGNSIFEPIWNRHFIDHVQITAAETVGVEHRGGYYEGAGALRDMVPNHLFQLVSLTAMEPPVSFDADAVREKQVEVLHALQPPSPEDVLKNAVRGQYGEGTTENDHLPAYRSEPNVAAGSDTETFVAAKLCIDNWRWADVPFYLRTGKRLAKRETEITIQFRRTPFVLFRNTPIKHLQTNRLHIRIQPEEGICLSFGAKVPGPVMKVGVVNMDFDYVRYFDRAPSTGYEWLLYDCMIGDATLFQRADMVEAGWKIIQPVLDVWKALPPRNFPNYAAGTWGPPEADELMTRDGREWSQADCL
ncbi:MAG: glucose-6-phosphate dehydrogenase [Acidobacteriia bacterium]|nr:glucose-6-phosphate dehydrogenase [Terriglobia bacterium]